jgi:hypothetical protein
VSTPPETSEGPSFIRAPLTWLNWWLNEKPPTNRSSVATAIWSIGAATLLTLLGGLVIKLVGPAGNVPGYLLVIVGGICLTAGLAVAWVLTRKNYELLVRSLKAEAEKLVAELELEKKRRADFEPSEETLRRLRVYSDHVYTAIGAMIAGELSLNDLGSDTVSRAICDVVRTHLRAATGFEFKLSLWGEAKEPRIRERISGAVSERLPDAVGDLVPARQRFTILAAPEHTPVERNAFEVAIDPSWLKWNQRQEDDHAEFVVFDADVPGMSALRGDDIAAFTTHEYQSVRAIAFQRRDMIAYLVVVSKAPQAFSDIEDQYLMWLKRMLELDSVIATGGATDRISSGRGTPSQA